VTESDLMKRANDGRRRGIEKILN